MTPTNVFCIAFLCGIITAVAIASHQHIPEKLALVDTFMHQCTAAGPAGVGYQVLGVYVTCKRNTPIVETPELKNLGIHRKSRKSS